MKAIDNQIGGSHYKVMTFQPIELIALTKCSFIQGCIIKYISRYKNKNGAQDIRKCIHYAQLAMELGDERGCSDDWFTEVNEYVLRNRLTILQRRIIILALYNSYDQVIQSCRELLQADYPEGA